MSRAVSLPQTPFGIESHILVSGDWTSSILGRHVARRNNVLLFSMVVMSTLYLPRNILQIRHSFVPITVDQAEQYIRVIKTISSKSMRAEVKSRARRQLLYGFREANVNSCKYAYAS